MENKATAWASYQNRRDLKGAKNRALPETVYEMPRVVEA